MLPGRVTPVRLHRADLVGVGQVTAAGCCYAAATIAIKFAYRYQAGAGTVALLRFVVSALALWMLARVVGVARLPEPRKLRSFMAMGLVSSVVGGLFVGSLSRIPAATSTLLLYAHPAMVAVATAVLGRERFNIGKGAALALSGAGLLLVLRAPGTDLDALGVGMALGAAVALATFIVLAQRAVVAVHPLVSSGLVQGTAAVVLAPLAISLGVELGRLPESAGWVVAVGLFTAGAISLFLTAVRRLGPTRAAIGATVEPVATVILGLLLLQEAISGLQLAGGAFVVAAVAILPVVERRVIVVNDFPPDGRQNRRE
jgi:drug/metabolite transporter (DMT)-like permease